MLLHHKIIIVHAVYILYRFMWYIQVYVVYNMYIYYIDLCGIYKFMWYIICIYIILSSQMPPTDTDICKLIRVCDGK